jgi:hypothetical protein
LVGWRASQRLLQFRDSYLFHLFKWTRLILCVNNACSFNLVLVITLDTYYSRQYVSECVRHDGRLVDRQDSTTTPTSTSWTTITARAQEVHEPRLRPTRQQWSRSFFIGYSTIHRESKSSVFQASRRQHCRWTSWETSITGWKG